MENAFYIQTHRKDAQFLRQNGGSSLQFTYLRVLWHINPLASPNKPYIIFRHCKEMDSSCVVYHSVRASVYETHQNTLGSTDDSIAVVCLVATEMTQHPWFT